MKLLILDTETTSADSNASICEIAGTLYQIGETERQTGAIATFATLLPVNDNPAEMINSIAHELTQSASGFVEFALAQLKKMAMSSDYAVAFNAEFDAPLVNQLIGEQRWLCAMRDFDWNYPNINAYGGYKLTDLALWLGIGISTVHRAGDDVRLLVECLNRRRAMLPLMVEGAIARSNSPMIEIKAVVSYENRELAKRAGFGWDSQRRIWVKKIRECDREKFLQSLDFVVEKI
jgi:DNA polymerase-3 subunit epsilon